MTRITVLQMTAALAAPAAAEPLTFEADEEVLVVRGVNVFGGAAFEFIGVPGARRQRVAMDASGTPIAVANALSGIGQIIFTDMPIGSADRVECRSLG